MGGNAEITYSAARLFVLIASGDAAQLVPLLHFSGERHRIDRQPYKLHRAAALAGRQMLVAWPARLKVPTLPS